MLGGYLAEAHDGAQVADGELAAAEVLRHRDVLVALLEQILELGLHLGQAVEVGGRRLVAAIFGGDAVVADRETEERDARDAAYGGQCGVVWSE